MGWVWGGGLGCWQCVKGEGLVPTRSRGEKNPPEEAVLLNTFANLLVNVLRIKSKGNAIRRLETLAVYRSLWRYWFSMTCN